MRKTSLSLATYNIHSFIGNDGRYDPDRIIEVIKILDADIIALQEVSSDYSDDLNLLDYLGRLVNMRVIPGPTMFRETSGYGNAVLARKKIEETSHLNISYKNWEPRGAISLTIQIKNKSVHIISTHMGLSRYERRLQTKRLLEAFHQRAADITVLMGDLNEWYPWSNPLRQLRKHFNNTASPASFPTRLPFLSLDRILVNPPLYLQSIKAIKNPLTRAAVNGRLKVSHFRSLKLSHFFPLK